MPRPAWSLFAYQLIEPDEQLDLFACQEVRVHLVARQLELGGSATVPCAAPAAGAAALVEWSIADVPGPAPVLVVPGDSRVAKARHCADLA
jgi:hypothetical protein